MTGEELFRAMEGIADEDLEHSEREVKGIVIPWRFGTIAAACLLVALLGFGGMKLLNGGALSGASESMAASVTMQAAAPKMAVGAGVADAEEAIAAAPETITVEGETYSLTEELADASESLLKDMEETTVEDCGDSYYIGESVYRSADGETCLLETDTGWALYELVKG